MADPLNLEGIRGLAADNADYCTIEGSCVTGFEPTALEEVVEAFGCTANATRGRVVFDMPVHRVREVLRLRTFDNFWVLIGHTPKFEYAETTEGQLAGLADYCLHSLDWHKGLRVWRDVFGYEGRVYDDDKEDASKCDEANGHTGDSVSSPEKKAKTEEGLPTFRCTCYRSGTNHSFKSPEAAKVVGGAVQEKFNWGVKMKSFDIEVVVNCDVDQVYVGLGLTLKSLYHRTITEFGPTTLRATICASMVRLARVQPGELVLDPMCGGASIPLEGAQVSPGGFYLCGDMHELAVGRAGANMRGELAAAAGGRVDCVRWDTVNSPLRDGSVDVLVTDLPFGKRSGSKADNRVLYPGVLMSMARVVRPTTGRAVLLTQDKNSMFKSMGRVSKFWKSTRHISCNIGGLTALVFLLARTSEVPTDEK